MSEINVESKSELLKNNLELLELEPNISRNDLRTCLETLITIFRNIDSNNDLKFRKIRIKNKSFHQKVWKYSSAKNFLLTSGWVQDTETEDNQIHEIIRFDESNNCLKTSLKLLIDKRDIKPDSNQWTLNNKLLINNSNKLREEELKRKANIERSNELEDFERQKREKELLALNIKKEIESDNRHRKLLTNNSNENANDIQTDSLVKPFSKFNI
jgi:hypothetical protein